MAAHPFLAADPAAAAPPSPRPLHRSGAGSCHRVPRGADSELQLAAATPCGRRRCAHLPIATTSSSSASSSSTGPTAAPPPPRAWRGSGSGRRCCAPPRCRRARRPAAGRAGAGCCCPSWAPLLPYFWASPRSEACYGSGILGFDEEAGARWPAVGRSACRHLGPSPRQPPPLPLAAMPPPTHALA
ncbi:hypothetical protein BS78_06G147000 [Paspalum vaginatum]|nr:hypothetical protein BS78_06G147000 [Paspalum vaginatum]